MEHHFYLNNKLTNYGYSDLVFGRTFIQKKKASLEKQLTILIANDKAQVPSEKLKF